MAAYSGVHFRGRSSCIFHKAECFRELPNWEVSWNSTLPLRKAGAIYVEGYGILHGKSLENLSGSARGEVGGEVFA